MNDTPSMVDQLDAIADRDDIDIDGRSVACRSWGAGPVVLLVHGASGCWTHWVRNIGPLSQRNRVVVPDLPGFGDSESLAGPPDAKHLADSLVQITDAVIGAEAQLDLVGFSFGGIVAGLAAHRMGQRAQHLVVISAGGIGINARVAGGPRRGPRDELIRFMFANPHTADDTALDIHLDGQNRTRFKTGSIPSSTLLLDVIGQVTAELHVVYSDRDAFGGGDRSVRLNLILGSRPDAKCHTITNAGHWSPYEAPDQINAILTQVLAPTAASSQGAERFGQRNVPHTLADDVEPDIAPN